MEDGLGNARLGDMARCLGATADAHLGHWEMSLASVTSLSQYRRHHAEIGPWCLALRMAAHTATRNPEISADLWRDALKHAPLEGLALHAMEFSANEELSGNKELSGGSATSLRAGAGGAGAGAGERGAIGCDRVAAARNMPVVVACRAFATQALWCSGAKTEATMMAEQVCRQLASLGSSPLHCLLPSAALAVGETVARACHVGMLPKKSGRRMLAECDNFLRVRAARLLPFAAALADRLVDVAPKGYL